MERNITYPNDPTAAPTTCKQCVFQDFCDTAQVDGEVEPYAGPEIPTAAEGFDCIPTVIYSYSPLARNRYWLKTNYMTLMQIVFWRERLR